MPLSLLQQRGEPTRLTADTTQDLTEAIEGVRVHVAELTGQEVPFELPLDYVRRAHDRTGQETPTTFLEGAARISEEREKLVRASAEEAVEALKRAAFDHLERLT